MSLKNCVAVPLCLTTLACSQIEETKQEQTEVAGQSQALGGIEGTMEYAMDAPWRLEPVRDANGNLSWGAIPIQISVHDGAQVPLDGSALTFGNFCELTVQQKTGNITHSEHFSLRALEEIEQGGRWKTNTIAPQPGHGVCRPAEANGYCEGF